MNVEEMAIGVMVGSTAKPPKIIAMARFIQTSSKAHPLRFMRHQPNEDAESDCPRNVDESSSHVPVNAFAVIQHREQQAPEDTQLQADFAVQNGIPSPQALAIAEQLAQADRGEPEPIVSLCCSPRPIAWRSLSLNCW